MHVDTRYNDATVVVCPLPSYCFVYARGMSSCALGRCYTTHWCKLLAETDWQSRKLMTVSKPHSHQKWHAGQRTSVAGSKVERALNRIMQQPVGR